MESRFTFRPSGVRTLAQRTLAPPQRAIFFCLLLGSTVEKKWWQATMTIHRCLSNGVEIPVLGFGVFQIPADQTEQAILDALETGYRSLDTARSYMNEDAVGGQSRLQAFLATSCSSPRSCGSKTKEKRRQGAPSRPRSLVSNSTTSTCTSSINRWVTTTGSCHGTTQPTRPRAGNRRLELPRRSARRPIAHNGITPHVNQIETHPFSSAPTTKS